MATQKHHQIPGNCETCGNSDAETREILQGGPSFPLQKRLDFVPTRHHHERWQILSKLVWRGELEKCAEAEQGCHFGRSCGVVPTGPTLGLECRNCFGFGSRYRIGPMYQDIILITLDAFFDQGQGKHVSKDTNTHDTSIALYKRNSESWRFLQEIM